MKVLIGIYLVCGVAAFALGMYGAATGKDTWAVVIAFLACAWFAGFSLYAIHKECQ